MCPKKFRQTTTKRGGRGGGGVGEGGVGGGGGEGEEKNPQTKSEMIF